MVALAPSAARSWGDCRMRVSRSLISACTNAPGSVSEKSLVFTLPMLASAIVLLVVVVVVLVEVSLSLEVVPETIELRGVKEMACEIPAVVPLAMVAARLRDLVRLASITMMSMTTSALGLSRSCSSFSASATWSAVARIRMAFCAL
jgi:hypothetical protein